MQPRKIYAGNERMLTKLLRLFSRRQGLRLEFVSDFPYHTGVHISSFLQRSKACEILFPAIPHMSTSPEKCHNSG